MLVAVFVTGPVAAGERRALLIGINDYSGDRLEPAGKPPQTPPGRSWPDLLGAVNDVEAMSDMLAGRYGFRRKNILPLTNQEATRAAILEAIDRHLVQPAAEGDVVVFYFAGHGSRVVNTKADESEEPDGKDETLVPADSRWGAPDIRDKELRRRFNEILDRGARLTVVLDSCYSGSGARGLSRWTRPRGLAFDPGDVADGSASGPRPEERGALVLSASQDFGLAWETVDEKSQDYGAFSLALLRALRASAPQEPAEHVFLRARAQLQIAKALQYPVLAGRAAERMAPIFGGRTDHRGSKTVVAVRRIEEDGTVSLLGGWANGLTVGSELRITGSRPADPGIALRITAIDGLSYSTAEIVETGRVAAAAAVEKGALAELSGWAAPPGPRLQVWIPQIGEDVQRLAKTIESAVRRAGLGWIADPVKESPTHVVSWRGQAWWLLGPDSAREELGAASEVAKAVARLGREEVGARLFLHLPAPPELARALEIGRRSRHDAVALTADPIRADYFLVGRLHGDAVEYAWVRPLVSAEDRGFSSLPLRTDWQLLGAPEGKTAGRPAAAAKLESAVLLLAKLRAWLSLPSPPGSDFPYQLAVKGENGDLATGGQLTEKTRPELVLRARESNLECCVVPRHVYVFVMDSHGESTLLFPASAQGSVENRFPIDTGSKTLPMEIPLGDHPLFEVSVPFGMDTYFLLTSEEPIPNPWVLQYPGVRVRGPKGKTALEELLSVTGSTRRGGWLVTPVTWSIERLVFESVED